MPARVVRTLGVRGSVVGEIGIRVDGQGILIRGASVLDVTSAAEGRLTDVLVKPGDTGTKIAHETGVSLSALEAANPGIDWKKLKVGQTVKTK